MDWRTVPNMSVNNTYYLRSKVGLIERAYVLEDESMVHIHEIARRGGANKHGEPLGLVNWMILNRKDSHKPTLHRCPTTLEVHDVIMSYDTEIGTLHVTA